jgi:hypothetical protein
VSVLCGQQDYVENAAFVSAAQAVASSVRLREIRNALYHDLREFRAVERVAGDTRTRRRTLEQITDDLTRLELDLSVSVEAQQTSASSCHPYGWSSTTPRSTPASASANSPRLSAACSAGSRQRAEQS